MSITLTRKFLDSQKIEVVTLADKYGSTMKVQHTIAKLSDPSYDAAEVEKSAIELMQANEAAWEQRKGK